MLSSMLHTLAPCIRRVMATPMHCNCTLIRLVTALTPVTGMR